MHIMWYILGSVLAFAVLTETVRWAARRYLRRHGYPDIR